LVEAGILAQDRRKVMGIFSSKSWPMVDGAPEAELRSRISDVLDRGDQPDQLTGCVIALIEAAGVLPVLLPTKEKDLRKARTARAKELATADGQGNWAVGATSAAVQATMAALAAASAATMVSTVIVTS
jgi:hypothetical protein